MKSARGLAAASALAALAAPAWPGNAAAQPALDGPYGDHAVIQRGAPIVLTGSSGADAVTVTLGPAAAEAAVQAGRWRAELPAMPAGGPYSLTLADADGETAFADVQVGDVWLCSGQSNMAFSVGASTPPEEDLAGPPPETMRLLSIPTAASVTPAATLPEGAAWAMATPETAQAFSAVCYFAARAAYRDEETPVGLINASWGGAQIEAFVPAESLRAAGGFDTQLDLLALYAEDPAAAMRGFGAPWEAWWRANYDGTEPWTGDGSGPGWKDAPDAMADWKTYDDAEAQGHLGQVWYARTFTLTEGQAAQGGRLALGMFDDVDATWLNGAFVGSTHSWSDPRVYRVGAGQLRAGENTIVINVLNTYGAGGMTGPAEDVALHLEGGETVPLAGGWRYDVVPETASGVPGTPWGGVNGFTTIHNGMIAPLGDIPLAAALWYQGESNTDHPDSYAALMTALIAGWRARFGPDLPVAVIQLPNYGETPDGPAESGWAEVREAQRRAAAADPLTGLVVTIDAGDPDNLHPPDKETVGRRAAAVLAALADGDGFPDGAAPARAQAADGQVLLDFPAALETRGGAAPGPFDLCAAGACTRAEAMLDGARIALSAPGTPAPDTVRYCWADAPVCSLVTMEGPPVSPFELAVE